MDNFDSKKPVPRNDRLSQLMYGKRREPPKSEPENIIEKYAGNIDYAQLMESMQTLMEAYHELKPAISKISPLITQFINKNKQ
ncbi:hypothetical protein [Peribacillus sp. SCS-155]|uniref:hypothetical protein n=1 Tax=Peribacillus sedimenti TaxID=3115297 RepID=UPI003906267A